MIIGVLGGDAGSGLGVGGLLSDATAYLGGVQPYHWFDFVNNRALYAGADVGNVTQATGYSFSRASTGYYTNADGTLTSFASGALRRGDRGVLIEGARTNLLTYSQQFDNAAWTKSSSVSVSPDAATAPDGTLTADRITVSSPSSAHALSQAVSVTAQTYTQVVYLKYNNAQWVQLFFGSTGFGGGYANFDLLNGVLGNTDATATIRALANGWYRCSLTKASSGSGSTSACAIVPVSSGSAVRFGSEVSGVFDIWGGQAEAGSHQSSYIPTTSASATRAADVLTYTAGVNYPLSLWAEFERAVDTGGIEIIAQVDSGSATDRARLEVTAADIAGGIVSSGGVNQAFPSVTGALAVGTVYKAAVRVATDNVNMARGGTLGTNDTSATMPATPTLLRVGTATEPFGYIRRIAVFNSALSDANLQTVTT